MRWIKTFSTIHKNRIDDVCVSTIAKDFIQANEHAAAQVFWIIWMKVEGYFIIDIHRRYVFLIHMFMLNLSILIKQIGKR